MLRCNQPVWSTSSPQRTLATPFCPTAPGCKTDNDAPWKRAVEKLFREFLQFRWPAAHSLVDWSIAVAPIFLEQELRPRPTWRAAGRAPWG